MPDSKNPVARLVQDALCWPGKGTGCDERPGGEGKTRGAQEFLR
jgi:hypothetical protein